MSDAREAFEKWRKDKPCVLSNPDEIMYEVWQAALTNQAELQAKLEVAIDAFKSAIDDIECAKSSDAQVTLIEALQLIEEAKP